MGNLSDEIGWAGVAGRFSKEVGNLTRGEMKLEEDILGTEILDKRCYL